MYAIHCQQPVVKVGFVCNRKLIDELKANVIENTARAVRIRNRVNPHILRHSFATNNQEKGMDLRFIMELLGHEGSENTEIYMYASKNGLQKFRNPFDDAFF